MIPISYLLANKYKLKDTVVSFLTKQIELEEAIISELNELVFITDTNCNILAINDAVEQALHKSKAELVNKYLFDVLYLRDKDGSIINIDSLGLDNILIEKKGTDINSLTLWGTPPAINNKVTMRVRPIKDIAGTIEQISFIIYGAANHAIEAHKNLEEAVVKHFGMIEELKNKLRGTKSQEFLTFLMISMTEKDILNTRTIDEHSIADKKAFVDIAKVCKESSELEKDFAKGFNVELEFSLPNFDMKDIASLIAPIFKINPENFTGPFFTAYCEVNYLGIAIQKILDLAVLLASTEQDRLVRVQVEREGDSLLVISITANTSQTVINSKQDLFEMYYGELAGKTNLSYGSGLEGYLVKKISDILNIPLKIVTNLEANQITFQLRLNRKKR
jgi:hypothetical protein